MTYAVFLHMQPPENWNGGVGFVSKEMIQSHCPAPAEDIQVNLECFFFQFTMRIDRESSILVSNLEVDMCLQILRCGPPPMNKAMAAHLDELNYTKEMQFQF